VIVRSPIDENNDNARKSWIVAKFTFAAEFSAAEDLAKIIWGPKLGFYLRV